MNIRVVGGVYGGRTLDAPSGRTTHPMGERIRNALFNSLGESVAGARVLDLFAGTGAVGIEALSRGAAEAVFVEKDRIAQKCITNNLNNLKITNAQLIKTTVSNWLNTYTGKLFDIIFADPPYHDTQLTTIKSSVAMLNPKGMLVLSWPEKEAEPEIASLKPIFNREYAGARIIVYKKEV